MTNETNSLNKRQFVSSLPLHQVIWVLMGFQDSRHTLTLTEDDEMVRFHLDYVEGANRLGEVEGFIHDDADGTYIEYQTGVTLEPYSHPVSSFIWVMATVGIIWLGSGLFAFLTASATAAWVFVFSLIALMILNRIDNETSPNHETRERECQYLMQRLNTAFEEAEKSYTNDDTQAQIAG